jgi:predicted DNA-binding protein with PD1-like motif
MGKKMKEKKQKQIKVIFEDGEEIVSGLKQALSEKKVEQAKMRSVSGSLSDIDLNYYIGGIKKKKHLNGKYRLTLIKGTLEEKGNLGYKGTLFVSLADGTGMEVIGGDLIKGKSVGETTVTALIEKFKGNVKK